MSTGTFESSRRSVVEAGSRPAALGGIEGFAARHRDALLLLARVLLGGIFVHSGLGKLMALDGFAASLAKAGLPLSSVLAVIGACVEFGGGLAIVFGLVTRYAAILMVLFVIAATLISHRFWELQDAARRAQEINFSKNIAIIGGFVLVFASGAGRFALDRLLPRSENA
ncbi:MAG TPA: DoxX family protein [Xanthobacteraceae bacterium]|jgi:putative oxidoreductase|nr:DoxX family protein [Xanthobacteraceae bacterium]